MEIQPPGFVMMNSEEVRVAEEGEVNVVRWNGRFAPSTPMEEPSKEWSEQTSGGNCQSSYIQYICSA